MIYDLEYAPPPMDRLIAGTLGRGAWGLNNASNFIAAAANITTNSTTTSTAANVTTTSPSTTGPALTNDTTTGTTGSGTTGSGTAGSGTTTASGTTTGSATTASSAPVTSTEQPIQSLDAVTNANQLDFKTLLQGPLEYILKSQKELSDDVATVLKNYQNSASPGAVNANPPPNAQFAEFDEADISINVNVLSVKPQVPEAGQDISTPIGTPGVTLETTVAKQVADVSVNTAYKVKMHIKKADQPRGVTQLVNFFAKKSGTTPAYTP